MFLYFRSLNLDIAYQYCNLRYKNYANDSFNENIDPTVFYDLTKEMALPLEDIAIDCTWLNNPDQNCTDLFKEVLTEDGVCYTFNLYPPEELLRMNKWVFLVARVNAQLMS